MRKNELKQLQGEVEERNTYKKLLGKCLFSLNQIPNKRIDNSENDNTKISIKN